MMQGYKLLQLLTALLICHFVAANHEHGHARTDHQKRAHYAPNSNTYWSRQQMQEVSGDKLASRCLKYTINNILLTLTIIF